MILLNKIAIVTGGASGIGAAIRDRFQAEGAHVTTVDLLSTDPCDVTDPAGVQAVMDRFERIDILVNSAGIAVRRPLAELGEADWDRVMDVNLKGVYLPSKYALTRMQRGSNIIHISSVVGITGVRNRAVYSATKGALVALTRNMALDYAPQGIRVNCICPGFVRTPLLKAILADHDKTARLTAMHPLGRLGTPEDIANAAVFLASEEASWITGHALVVDGGFSVGRPEDI
jgi:NAD(P)-dependent dehydrogenase (short-subunit alcohol dehydrogenase family)